MRFFSKIIIIFTCVLVPSLSWAEIIQLKSGQSIEGKILHQDKDSIQVDAGIETPVTYFSDEIKAILPDGPKPAAKIDSKQADQWENQAVGLIDEDKMQEGLRLMKKAVALDPTPMRHMNYGSILFGNGVADFKDGRQSQAMDTLHQAEDELDQAIAGFDPQKDNVFLAQAYFLLGEMYLNAFTNQDKAKTFYQKALTYYDHAGAKAALAKFQ